MLKKAVKEDLGKLPHYPECQKILVSKYFTGGHYGVGEITAVAAFEYWFKELAPNEKLQDEYEAGRISFEEFEKAYRAEMSNGKANKKMKEIRKIVAETEPKDVYLTTDEGRNPGYGSILMKLIEEVQ